MSSCIHQKVYRSQCRRRADLGASRRIRWLPFWTGPGSVYRKGPIIRDLHYDELKDIAQGAEFKRTDTVTWINVDGLHDLALMKDIGRTFDLHPLLTEDILNTGQRPKLEEFDNCLFLVVKMLRYDKVKTNDYPRTIK